ncbi:restriction endonuclease subunit S [Chamaesiphon minutus]|uniref:Restriction endonuclease S subunit n=1 Tax=Chamaesiphon minutus (strain ATCC 27169 / PCC 6605) TaxID=1173020 RepID=K9UC61_CHAP6|nr:restriction endonuclease subunit S [Chamaesiphon minutus]AFY91774.1 restriction endonuclease S subunit [Chamaesiphon minutus PCC 6605]
MKGWLKTTLGNHVDIITGYPFKSELYTESEQSIRLLRGDNIIPGSTRWDGAKHWSLNNVEGLNKYYLNPQDLIIAMDRVLVSNGLKIAIIREEDVPALLVQRVARLRANKGLEQKFLPYLVMSHRFEQYVKSVQTETAIPHISTQQINDFPIVLPPLLEQCRIAEILGVWDESIDLLEKLIGRVRSRKQGLMQQLLTGKKRFKEFEGSEWKKVSLEKIADINPRSHPNNLQFVGEFVEMASVSESGHLKNIASINLDTSTSGYTAFINGDTLVAKITPCFENGKGAFIEGLRGIGFGSTEFFVLRAKMEIIPIYLYYLTRTYNFGMRGKTMMQGSGGQQRVPSDFIRQFAVKLPSIPEQEKIAAVLSAADEEISTLEKQLAAYKQQKLGLMQQLLTGKIRVEMI